MTTVYLLVVSGLLLGFGRAGDLYGQKRVYMLGFVVFIIGSALCGAAPSAHWLIALTLAWRVIHDDRPEESDEKFDIPGAVLFIAGLVAFLIALNQGHSWGWLSAPTLGLAGLGVVILGVFIRVELRSESPMLDLSLFKTRLFSASTTSAYLNYICVYSVVFVLPFLLIQGRGLDTQQTGLILTAQPLIMAIAAPISGTLSDRLGTRGLATVGMAILAFGLAFLAWAVDGRSLWMIAGALAVVGLGTGIFGSPARSSRPSSPVRRRTLWYMGCKSVSSPPQGSPHSERSHHG